MLDPAHPPFSQMRPPYRDPWEKPYVPGTFVPGQIIRTKGLFSWIIGKFVHTFTDTFNPDITWVTVKITGERRIEGDYLIPTHPMQDPNNPDGPPLLPYIHPNATDPTNNTITVRHEMVQDFSSLDRKHQFPASSKFLPSSVLNAPKQTFYTRPPA